MKNWRIPVTWEMFGVVEIEADTLQEAMEIAKNDDNVDIPTEAYYIDGSFNTSYDDVETVRCLYNDK